MAYNVKETLADKFVIMGIVNVTPDSFSDGGDYNSVERSVSRIKKMIQQGAKIIDLGGQSTRPGYEEVPPEEELNRLLPVIEAVREFSDVLISIDTYFPEVARQSLEAGANIVNDIHGGDNLEMLEVIADHSEAGYVYMHSRDRGETPLEEEMKNYHEEMLDKFEKYDIDLDRVSFDPGVGWKSHEDHIAIMSEPEKYSPVGELSVLLGVSRKRTIGTITGHENAKDRDVGSAVASLMACAKGVNIVRVHNVQAMADAVAVYQALRK